MGDTSSHELKFPVNSETDRGVSKSIFYGTQRVSNLNHEIQRYSNGEIPGNHAVNDFSKTQSVQGSSQGRGYSRGGNNSTALNERSSKND